MLMKERDALFVVDTILDSMKDVIVEGNRLEIRDFGVFQIKERKPRIGRNPRNKVAYPIPPHNVVTFKPGKDLKELPVAYTGRVCSEEEQDDLEALVEEDV